MSPRRSQLEDMVATFVRLPWWVPLVLAGGFFVVFGYLLPGIVHLLTPKPPPNSIWGPAVAAQFNIFYIILAACISSLVLLAGVIAWIIKLFKWIFEDRTPPRPPRPRRMGERIQREAPLDIVLEPEERSASGQRAGGGWRGDSDARAPYSTLTQPAPHCPLCNASMVMRTASRGANRGRQFWGCPAFPNCRGTREV
ncbi:MAG: hypothetical protein ACYDBB_21465 [Armatimonadota bacterium]